MNEFTIKCSDVDLQAIKDGCACLREIALLEYDPHAVTDLPTDGEALGAISRAFMRSVGMYPPSAVATCIGCGCTDNAACAGGCEWLAVDHDSRRGVCSNCREHLDAFAAQQRVADLRRTIEECCS
jgi:hypothetical protein